MELVVGAEGGGCVVEGCELGAVGAFVVRGRGRGAVHPCCCGCLCGLIRLTGKGRSKKDPTPGFEMPVVLEIIYGCDNEQFFFLLSDDSSFDR